MECRLRDLDVHGIMYLIMGKLYGLSKSLPPPPLFSPPPNLKLFLSYASKGTDPWEKEGTAHCQERWRDLRVKSGEKYFSLEIWVLYSEEGGFQTQKDLTSFNRRDNIWNDSMKKSTTIFSKFPLKPFSAVGWTISGGVFPNDNMMWLVATHSF